MKKLTIITACVLYTAKLFAQDCTQYMYLQKDKTIGMTFYDKNKKVTMASATTVSDVQANNGVTTANVSSQACNKNGKLIGGITNGSYKCDGGVFSMNMAKLRAKLGCFGAKMATPAPRTTSSAIWFAPNFGVVKKESKESYCEFTSLK